MTHTNLHNRRSLGTITILIFLVGINSLFAQPFTTQYHPRKFFIKLTDQAIALRGAPSVGSVSFNQPSIDSYIENLSVERIKPVLSPEDIALEGETYGLERVFVVEMNSEPDIPTLIDELNALVEVEYAEPIYRSELDFTPNDEYYSESWHHTNIQSAQAWDITTGSDEVIISIIDTGVDTDHPDLVDNLWSNPGEIPNNGIDDDGNGKVDDIHGWDFSGSVNNPVEDANVNHDWGWHPDHAEDHGSHCAGIAAGVGNNEIGVTGIAFTSKVMAIKIFPNPYDDVIVNAIRYAADNGADILSNSWGGTTPSSTINDAILYARNTKGCIVMGAAGNSNSSDFHYPAAYPEVIAVGATNSSDNRRYNSNHGAWVDMCAPGTTIWSCTDPNNPYHLDHDYLPWGGTSMACPMVAGAAALIRSRYPDLDVNEQEALLMDGDDVGDIEMGKRLNVFKCLVPYTVNIDQQLESGVSVSTIGHWESSNFVEYSVPNVISVCL